MFRRETRSLVWPSLLVLSSSHHTSSNWPQSDQVTWNAVNGGAGAGKNYQNTFVSLSFTHPLQLLLNNTSEKKVRIVIEPSQVRLVTGADDLYTWKVLPQKKHLFSKNISDHSIGAYKELCEGIDSAFEAVLVTTKPGRDQRSMCRKLSCQRRYASTLSSNSN